MRANLRRRLSSRPVWVALGLIAVVLFAIGSYHPVRPTAAERIANLENILRCPSCASASLSQSETVGANELKATVVRWVHEGMSDRAIESRLVASYGPAELLRPSNPALWAVPAAAVAVAATGLGWYLVRRRPSDVEVTADDERLIDELLEARAVRSDEGGSR